MNPDCDCCLIKLVKTELRVLRIMGGLGWCRQARAGLASFQGVLYKMTGSVKFLSVHRRFPYLRLSCLETCLPCLDLRLDKVTIEWWEPFRAIVILLLSASSSQTFLVVYYGSHKYAAKSPGSNRVPC